MKVLITGASSGIGRALAEALVGQCDQMILVGRDQARLTAVATALRTQSATVQVVTVATDLTVVANCQQLHAAYPDVDLLINNAGVGAYGAFVADTLEQDLSMIQTNVVALHVLTKSYLATMHSRNRGQILNVASVAGFMAGPLMSTYYATKNYVVRLSEGIREELRREKSAVKISVLCPGPVATNFATRARIPAHFHGVDSGKIARYAVKHLHQFYIIPTWQTRLARWAAGLLPSSWLTRIMYRIQAKRRG